MNKTKNLLVIFWAFLLSLGSNNFANAEHVKYLDGVIVDDTSTEPKGKFALRSLTLQTADPGIYTTIQYLRLDYGVTDHLSFFIAPEVYRGKYGSRIADKHDFGDISLAGKYQFLINDTLSFAGKFTVKLAPNDSAYIKGFSTGEEDYKMEFLTSKFFGLAKLNLVLGYNIIGNPPGKNYADELNYALAIMYPIKKVLLTGELVGKTDKTKGKGDITFDANILDLWMGAKWVFSKKPDIKLKTGIGTRVSHPSPDYLAAFAVIWYL